MNDDGEIRQEKNYEMKEDYYDMDSSFSYNSKWHSL